MKKQITLPAKTCKFIILVLSFFPFMNVGGQDINWQKKTSMLYPVVGQSACMYDGKIYVTGGSKDGALHNGDYGDPFLQIYDIQTDNWTFGTPMPTARWMHGSAEVNSVIYCIGGGWNIALATNEAYDIASGTWSTRTPMPTPRSSLGVATIDNKIYTIGGFGSDKMYNINEMYNPETDTWTAKAPMPTTRVGFGTTVVDGKIYVMGGCIGPWDPLKKVEVYDPQTNTWEKKKDMPSYRFGLVLAPIGKKIYAMGGTPTNQTPSPGKVEVYDIETDTWTKLANLPDSTQWGAGGSWNNKVYILGGEDMCMMTFPKQAKIYDFLYESDIVTGIEEMNHPRKNSFMVRVYPNPFKIWTTLHFELPDQGFVKIELYNALGKNIQTMVADLKPLGSNSANLDGSGLPAGIYYCRLSTGEKTAFIKLIKRN